MDSSQITNKNNVPVVNLKLGKVNDLHRNSEVKDGNYDFTVVTQS